MKSGPLDVRVSGPLVPFRDGFGEYLDGCGYARVSATNHVRLLAHVSRWMASVGLDVGELSRSRVNCSWLTGVLGATSRICRCRRWCRCWGFAVGGCDTGTGCCWAGWADRGVG